MDSDMLAEGGACRPRQTDGHRRHSTPRPQSVFRQSMPGEGVNMVLVEEPREIEVPFYLAAPIFGLLKGKDVALDVREKDGTVRMRSYISRVKSVLYTRDLNEVVIRGE